MSRQLSLARRGGGFDSLGQDAVGPAEVGEPLDDADIRHELDPQWIVGGRSATAREMRFTPAGASLRRKARRPAPPSRSAARLPEIGCRRRGSRDRLDSDTHARGGSRRSRRTRSPAPPFARTTRRGARAASHGPPSGWTRTPRRGSAGGGTGMRARPRRRGVGTHELLATSAARAPRRVRLIGRESVRPTLVEHLTLDGGSSIPGARPCRADRGVRREARGSSGAPARREIAGHRPAAVLAYEQAVVDEHREHLLDEERIALGGAGDPRRPRGDSSASPTRFATSSEHSSSERGSSNTVVAFSLPPAPSRPNVEQLRPGDAKEQQRHSRDHSARCSTRSRNVASPQCTSSKTTTSGCVRASASSSRWTAANPSSAPSSPRPCRSSRRRAERRLGLGLAYAISRRAAPYLLHPRPPRRAR